MATAREHAALAARLTRVEAAVARLAGAVESVADAVAARVADAMADVRPLVLTKAQLKEVVRAAMEMEEVDEEETTPLRKKRKTATQGLTTVLDAVERVETDRPSPSPLTLSMLDTIASSTCTTVTPPLSPIPSPSPPPPPPPPKPTKKRSPRTAAPPPPPPPQPAPQAPMSRPPLVVPSRPIMAIPPPQQQPQQQAHIVPAQFSSANGTASSGPRYLWGNAWHHLPEDYEFPKESLEVMWRQWCCGVVDKGYRPLRDIRASDIATTNNRKRLSDLKFLMKFIEQHLQDRGVWKELPSEIEADQMLLAVRSAMPFTATTAKNGQKRELEDLKWHSAVTLLRNANKKARAE